MSLPKCPICWEYLDEPVVLKCGHTSCRGCIATVLQSRTLGKCCPVCRDPLTTRVSDLRVCTVLRDLMNGIKNKETPTLQETVPEPVPQNVVVVLPPAGLSPATAQQFSPNAPDMGVFSVDKLDIVFDPTFCRARRLRKIDESKLFKPYLLQEFQCMKEVAADAAEPLCGTCVGRKARGNMWEGLIDEPPLPTTHMPGTAWATRVVFVGNQTTFDAELIEALRISLL